MRAWWKGNFIKLIDWIFQKTVDVAAAPKGVTVTLRKTKVANKPVATANATTFTKGTRGSAKSVKNLLAHYRPDLEKVIWILQCQI